MIGSLMSRLGDAEKLSVGQLKDAIQDGTVPAYVGVPLLQDKIAQAKKAKMAMAGQTGPQPSIAQQVMGEAQGIAQAQSNLPAQGFADGGILNFQPVPAYDGNDGYAGGGMVAFDEGGDVDEEDDSSSSEFGYSKEEEKLFNALRASANEPSEYEGIAGLMGANEAGTGIRSDAKAPRGIEALGFVEKIKRLESGGKHHDKEGNILTSSKGAQGIMQVMPYTQRDPGYGVKPAKDNSPQELERVGIDYANAMLREFGGNEKLAAMAYNWGPGNVNKWLAGGMKGEVPKETRQYAANFAEGGIAHFDEGGVSRFGQWWNEFTAPTERSKEYQERNKRYDEMIKAFREQPGLFEKVSPETLAAAKERISTTGQALKAPATPTMLTGRDQATEAEDASFAAPAAAATPAPIPPAPANEPPKPDEISDPYKEYINQLASSIKSREERLTKDRETDKYMALLSAGLGMMGGTSPYAAANIGQGAQQGIQAALANRKAQIAEENAIASSRLGLTKADLYRGMHLEDIKQKALARGDRQAYLQADLAIKQQKADIAKQLAPLQAQKGAIAAEKAFGDSGAKAEIEGQLKDEFGKNWKKDTKAQGEFKRRRAAWIRDNIGGSEGSATSFESLMQE